MVTPRRAYRPDKRLFRRTGLVSRVPGELAELSALIADLEHDGKGVPILSKQYLKTGGRLLRFNVDRKFSDAIDALIMVNLPIAPAEFRAYHAVRG